MPVFDPRERPIPVMPLLVITNLLPLIGIVYYNLSFFAFFYLYWVETVLIGIFRWLKMIKANKHAQPDPNFKINGEPLTYKMVNSRVYMMGMYFFWRSFILIFYLVFIVVFVGFMGSDTATDSISVGRAMLFMEPWMQITLLSYFLTQLIDYIQYLAGREYEDTSLVELANVFDARTVVLHVVIVLGVFLSKWVSEDVFPHYPGAGTIAYASLFVVVKTLADIFSYKWQTSRLTTVANAFGKSTQNNSTQ